MQSLMKLVLSARTIEQKNRKMLILLSSPDAVAQNGRPDPELVEVLKTASAASYPTGLVSNHPEPAWFDSVFRDSEVQFLQVRGRQDGTFIARNAEKFDLAPYHVLVLASKPEDIHMGKNGGAVLLAAGWSQDRHVQGLGIQVNDASELRQIIELHEGWSGQWWFSGENDYYAVRALVDLSGYGKSLEQRDFAQKLTSTVKNGGARLNALLAVTARSLLADGIGRKSNLVWGVYPSSHSANDDAEVLSDFTHRLRTTVSRVQFAKKGEPLFIRHSPSSKRSSDQSSNREDPTEQVCTVHLNPFYKRKRRLKNKHVIVIDDCTTYGVSFGVAAAFLRRAGAEAVTGVALGKFGDKLGQFDLSIDSDPFGPVSASDFSVKEHGYLGGITSSVAQHTLRRLIP